MTWRDLLLRLRALVMRRRVETELDEELQFHVAMQARKHQSAGVEPDAAARTAARQFGGMARIKDECRDQRGLGLIDAAHQDLRHALRMLRRQPGLTLAVALTLGAGIGVTTAIFSLVHAVLLRPFPYPEPEQLVRVYSGRVASPTQRGGLSVLDIEAMRERAGAFSNIAGCVMFDTNLAGGGPARP